MRRDLERFLAEGGAIGGGAAIGATIGFVVGTVVHDFRPEVDPGVICAPLRAAGRARAGLVVLIEGL